MFFEKDEILKLVKQYPKHYSIIIRKNPILFAWVEANHKLANNTDSIGAKIYSAVYQESDVCSVGNVKKYTRWSTGFSNCGPAAICKCTQQQISENVQKTKSAYSQEDHDRINQKRKDTMKSIYGVESTFQRPEMQPFLTRAKVDMDVYNKITDREWLNEEYINKKRTSVDIADELGIDYSTVIFHCNKSDIETRSGSNYSLVERKVSVFLDELGVEHKTNVTRMLSGKLELDIYVPTHNFAIEINGLYHHSTKRVDAKQAVNKHISKTLLANEKNIELFHVTDWEWDNKQDIIKSMIKTKLGFNQKIHARKCTIKQVSTAQSREFLDQYHLQGYIPSKFYLGLYYNNDLIMMMTAGKPRFNKTKYDLEIYRMCSKSGITVVGGASKLLAYLRDQYNVSSIITYCDRSKSVGNGYMQMGFKKIGATEPGYFWTNGNLVVSRYQTQKSRLQSWLKSYDASKSQTENMIAAGYGKFWDCGNYIFVYNT